ncbi:TonB-dependent receptor [Arsukibacterium indicum]|uniref:TonB-dependent receptor n=1 Tax=Arsukibacterium indicum TaxID=2848612 RepID=A0ABS6MQ52_9GAMM|nr:TonB-dependent receptor [Arsukibacterium indicum]MBV2130959.1 TonB-dependent receptor [Arsukibacterium indicum]
MKGMKKSALNLAICAGLFGVASFAATAQTQETDSEQKDNKLETITITAQKRSQSIQEVPISVATISQERFNAIFSTGDDITALAVKVPGLYAETSNGRAAPRFYIRGLGNTDFDLAASQPVSIIMDEVVMENVILKSFPLFDVQAVEVIRGPQGTLFGRNTTAGIIKFDSVKPRQDFDGYFKTTAGTLGMMNVEGAIGGGLTDELSARVSLMSNHRDDWVSNSFYGNKDVMGGYDEIAGRLQFLYEGDDFDALLNLHTRNYDGTSSLFRANILSPGSNELNENYDRDTVAYNEGRNNPQSYDAWGGSLKLDFQLTDMTLTSISAIEKADGGGIGDIDGGNPTGPGVVPFQAVTEDQLRGLKQVTQEIRLASDTDNALSWQTGAFYFDSTFSVNSIDGFFGATEVFHGNTSWALFGQSSYKVDDKLDITAGIRYTDDEKTFYVGEQNVDGFALVIGAAQEQYYAPIRVSDDNISWELSANYRLTGTTSLFARVAEGFRAQSIQGRDVAFEAPPSVADAETITSFEVGAKSDLLDNTLRLNGALFYYTIDDIQLSAIGGQTQGNQLINADKGVGYGFEIDFDWRATPYFTLGGGFSYNNTELQDDNLTVAPCGSGMCTVLDPVNSDGQAFIRGNPFPQAPETILTLNGRYDFPIESGEIYVYGDYQLQGKTNLFLYESAEFSSNNNFEAGLRVAYINYEHNYEVGFFGRNITDEDNLKGAIDFNNLTGFVNEPRVLGVDFRINFY